MYAKEEKNGPSIQRANNVRLTHLPEALITLTPTAFEETARDKICCTSPLGLLDVWLRLNPLLDPAICDILPRSTNLYKRTIHSCKVAPKP